MCVARLHKSLANRSAFQLEENSGQFRWPPIPLSFEFGFHLIDWRPCSQKDDDWLLDWPPLTAGSEAEHSKKGAGLCRGSWLG